MAQNNLANCLPVTLKYEGGLSLVRADPGNWSGAKVGVGELRGTKYGIAASAHPEIKNIAGLTVVEAESIYERAYWRPAGCETLPIGLDLCHFDGSVNSGLARSKTWLASANKSNVTTTYLIHAYSGARLHSLQSFKTWATFGKGWAARVAGVEAAAIKMATAGAPAAASQIIAAKGAAVAVHGKVTKAASYASAGVTTAAGTLAATGHHPYVSVAVGVASIVSAIWGAFHSSVSGARAATLANAAVS